jgi:hypothetical protein
MRPDFSVNSPNFSAPISNIKSTKSFWYRLFAILAQQFLANKRPLISSHGLSLMILVGACLLKIAVPE